jgi:hypothetical protein
MRTKIARVLRRIAIATLGVLYGYLLWTQILPLPDALRDSLMQGAAYILKASTEAFALVLPYEAMLSVLSFTAAIPNTIFVAVLAGLTVRQFGQHRVLMYSVLVWPVFLHAFHWFYVWYIERVATQTGVSPALASYKESYFFPSKALAILLIYSLFFVLAYFILRIAGPSTHNPPLNTDAPPTGGAPVS